MKQPTGLACLFVQSSSGVDPVISSHTQLSRYFTNCPKNKITKNKRRVQRRKDKHRFRTAKCTATKDADSSGHCLSCSVSLFLTPYCPPTALNPCLRAD